MVVVGGSSGRLTTAQKAWFVVELAAGAGRRGSGGGDEGLDVGRGGGG